MAHAGFQPSFAHYRERGIMCKIRNPRNDVAVPHTGSPARRGDRVTQADGFIHDRRHGLDPSEGVQLGALRSSPVAWGKGNQGVREGGGHDNARTQVWIRRSDCLGAEGRAAHDMAPSGETVSRDQSGLHGATARQPNNLCTDEELRTTHMLQEAQDELRD